MAGTNRLKQISGSEPMSKTINTPKHFFLDILLWCLGVEWAAAPKNHGVFSSTVLSTGSGQWHLHTAEARDSLRRSENSEPHLSCDHRSTKWSTPTNLGGFWRQAFLATQLLNWAMHHRHGPNHVLTSKLQHDIAWWYGIQSPKKHWSCPMSNLWPFDHPDFGGTEIVAAPSHLGHRDLARQGKVEIEALAAPRMTAAVLTTEVPKMGVPPVIIHFDGICPYKPSILRDPYFRKPPYVLYSGTKKTTSWPT